MESSSHHWRRLLLLQLQRRQSKCINIHGLSDEAFVAQLERLSPARGQAEGAACSRRADWSSGGHRPTLDRARQGRWRPQCASSRAAGTRGIGALTNRWTRRIQ